MTEALADAQNEMAKRCVLSSESPLTKEKLTKGKKNTKENTI